jgi:hypothetical protein
VPRGMRAASCHSGPFPLACGPSPLWNGKRAPPSGEPCWYRPHGTRNLRAGALCLADYPVPASPPNHRRGEPACVGGPENLPHRSASRPAAWPGCYLTDTRIRGERYTSTTSARSRATPAWSAVATVGLSGNLSRQPEPLPRPLPFRCPKVSVCVLSPGGAPGARLPGNGREVVGIIGGWLVTPAGFEPAISTLKGLRPGPG